MESLARIQTRLMKKTVVTNITKSIEIVLTQWKESYKGVSLYRIFSEIRVDGDTVKVDECYSTYGKKASNDYFYGLERRYPKDRRKRKGL